MSRVDGLARNVPPKGARGFADLIKATDRSHFRLRELFPCCDDGREILEKRDCFLDGELIKKERKVPTASLTSSSKVRCTSACSRILLCCVKRSIDALRDRYVARSR